MPLRWVDDFDEDMDGDSTANFGSVVELRVASTYDVRRPWEWWNPSVEEWIPCKTLNAGKRASEAWARQELKRIHKAMGVKP